LIDKKVLTEITRECRVKTMDDWILGDLIWLIHFEYCAALNVRMNINDGWLVTWKKNVVTTLKVLPHYLSGRTVKQRNITG